jgi:hypothetical protein
MKAPWSCEAWSWFGAACHGGGSSSSTRRETNTIDRRIAATDRAQVAAEGGRVSNRTVNRTTIRDVSPAVAEVVSDLAESVSDDSTGVAREATKEGNRTTREALDEALDFAGAEAAGARGLVDTALGVLTSGFDDVADLATSSNQAVSRALELEQQREQQGLAGLEKTLQALTIVGVAGAAAFAFSRG